MSGGFVSEIQINEYIVSEIDRKSHAVKTKRVFNLLLFCS